jgi:hypothetical protein
VEGVGETLYRNNKTASKIKITVVDKNNNYNLRLPAIPLWLLSFLGSIGMRFKSIALKNSDNLDQYSKKFLEELNSKDVKKLIKELKRYGPFDLIDVSTGDGTIVKISIL